jgi:hypothetical protein
MGTESPVYKPARLFTRAYSAGPLYNRFRGPPWMYSRGV